MNSVVHCRTNGVGRTADGEFGNPTTVPLCSNRLQSSVDRTGIPSMDIGQMAVTTSGDVLAANRIDALWAALVCTI